MQSLHRNGNNEMNVFSFLQIKELFNELNDLVAKGKFLDSMLYELKAATYKRIEQKEFDREDKFQFFCDFFFN